MRINDKGLLEAYHNTQGRMNCPVCKTKFIDIEGVTGSSDAVYFVIAKHGSSGKMLGSIWVCVACYEPWQDWLTLTGIDLNRTYNDPSPSYSFSKKEVSNENR